MVSSVDEVLGRDVVCNSKMQNSHNTVAASFFAVAGIDESASLSWEDFAGALESHPELSATLTGGHAEQSAGDQEGRVWIG